MPVPFETLIPYAIITAVSFPWSQLRYRSEG